jgi:hypothetical protein
VTDHDREPSTLTIACFVPVDLVAMAVVLIASNRCIYATPQVAELRVEDGPVPARPRLDHDAHTRDREDPDEVRGVQRHLEDGQRLGRRDRRKPPE